MLRNPFDSSKVSKDESMTLSNGVTVFQIEGEWFIKSEDQSVKDLIDAGKQPEQGFRYKWEAVEAGKNL